MSFVAVLLVAAAVEAPDPRPRLVELSLAGRLRESLVQVQRRLAEEPEQARALGLDLLRGDLLHRLGRQREAAEAYARAMATGSTLAPWARLRLAAVQEELGHPEVAAGLVASLLTNGSPTELERRALSLFERTLDAGGDCRLVSGLPRERFSGDAQRRRDLLALRCQAARNEPLAIDQLRRFLLDATDDAHSWEAALPFLDRPQMTDDRTLGLLVGLSAYHHRDFAHALGLLGGRGAERSRGPFDRLASAAAYAEARSEFWMGHYGRAAELFGRIAQEHRTAPTRADAYFQRARSRELEGDADAAHADFERAFLADPHGEWAGPALLSLLRLEYLRGDPVVARRRLIELAAGGSRTAAHTARGALFLAVSELARGRTTRVSGLLSTAARTREVADEEVSYWRGRLAELAGDGDLALDEYLRAATERPFHPFARAARARWAAPPLAELARARGLALAGSSDPRQLWTSHVLAVSAGGSSPMQARALARLAQYPATEAWVTGESLTVADWPLWRTALESPQEKLLALGLAVDAPAAVSEHFPADPARTGLTGATLLVPAPTTRRGIALAERVFSRRPRQVPLEWVSPRWLSVLYPRPWAELIESQAAARGVDPALLTAVLREESRFDAAAVSPAAARGLAQFVLPTARRLAPTTGLATLAARDLHDPMVAIPLAASYLAELARRFQGDEIAMAAAYNAGEDQTALWQRGCASAEPEELLSKITFGETRAYVTRVLESRDAYRWLARSSH